MSTTITVEEAQAKLPELISMLAPGQEVFITLNHQPVAKLVGARAANGKRREPGNCKGMITLLVEDEEHLKDFAEYMP